MLQVKHDPVMDKYYFEVGLPTKCECPCHQKDSAIMHFMACCENGWIAPRRVYIKIVK